MINYILCFIAGVIVASAVRFVVEKRRVYFGTLVINTSNPEKDTYTLEIADMSAAEKKKFLYLTVKKE